MQILKLTLDLYEKYLKDIQNLYFQNTLAHQYTENTTINETNKKIVELREYLKEDKAHAFICVTDEDVCCGFFWAFAYSFRGRERFYVGCVQVDEEYRGQKIGEKMLAVVEECAKENGYNEVFFNADAVNVRARKFYENQGYFEERIQLCKKI